MNTLQASENIFTYKIFIYKKSLLISQEYFILTS